MLEKRFIWVKWARVTTPKKLGGLGIKRLEDVNDALIFKWAWRFRAKKDSLWRNVVEACHKSNNMWEFLPINKYAAGNWKAIVKVIAGIKVNEVPLHSFIRAKVRNGNTIRFWLDIWLGDCTLKNKFPLLYRLEDKKSCLISERTMIVNNQRVVTAEWIEKMQDTEELLQWVSLCELVANEGVMSGQDSWFWAADTDVGFTTNGTTKMLMHRTDFEPCFVIKWVSWVPMKCMVMVWRAEMNRIPTKMELVKRKVQIEDRRCPWCKHDDETAIHILSDCIIATNVWDWIGRWCRLDPIYAFEIKDILEVYKKAKGCKKSKKIVHGIIIVTMWSMWKARNDSVFSGKRSSVESIVASVKSFTFLWINSRFKCNKVVWKEWCRFPLYMFVTV